MIATCITCKKEFKYSSKWKARPSECPRCRNATIDQMRSFDKPLPAQPELGFPIETYHVVGELASDVKRHIKFQNWMQDQLNNQNT